MLNRIFIQNFALIEHLDIHLNKGLQVITGETGAGKSIILGALRLILGERADAKSVVKEDKKSIVEVEFITDESLKNIFEELELDYEIETIIRREILPSGKSRAFVNDVPTTLENLKKITEKLIDIHSQFETQKIFTEKFQFGIIDGIADNNQQLQEYQLCFAEYQKLNATLRDYREKLSINQQEADYKKFLVDELVNAQLDDIDWENMQQQLATQEHAEAIAEQINYAIGRMDADEIGILDSLRTVLQKLQKIQNFSSQYETLAERLDSSYQEIKDIYNELSSEAEKLELNPLLIDSLQQKINQIQGLFLKHNTENVEKLIEIRNTMQQEQYDLENIEENIQNIQKQINETKIILEKKASTLGETRGKAAQIFKSKIETLLKQLGLEKAKIIAELTPSEQFHILGKETIRILFQANSGFPMNDIQNAISGGERSRVMLAIKKIMAETQKLPTLVLDEIDTGVSGKVAEEIGKVMKEMAKDMQLIVISHLAQVAAKGDHNYKVHKFDIDGVTQSTIKQLSEEEKLNEIAQLLSGSTITNAAIEQAKALIKN